MSEPGDMPRVAMLLALLLLTVTAAMSQAGGASLSPGGGARPQKPWDARPYPAAGPVLSLFAFHPAAQPAAAHAPDTLHVPTKSGDSLRADSLQADSVRADSSVAPRGKKDSWTAVGLSAVLPGAGQVYTENYWKVPVILGLGAYWVYEWNRNDDKYVEYRDLYEQSIASSPPYGDEQYLALREAYKDQRDAFAWYIGILYLVNIADAYVGAELYDFDVGPDLGAGGGGAYATLRIHF